MTPDPFRHTFEAVTDKDQRRLHMSLFSTIAHHETPQMRHVSRRGIEIAIVIAAVMAGIMFLVSENWPTSEEAIVEPTAETGLAYSDFVRLNTTDLEYPAATGGALAGTTAAAAVDPFTVANVESYAWLNNVYEERYGAGFAEMNIGSYDWLNEIRAMNSSVNPGFINMNVDSYDWLNAVATAAPAAYVVDPGFLAMNVDSYEGLTPTYTAPYVAAQVVDPGFINMNVGSYDGLNAIYTARHAADPGFLAMNVDSFLWLNRILDPEWTQQPSGPR